MTLESVDALSTSLTHQEPFGPPGSEGLIQSNDVFLKMYMSHNKPHLRAATERPTYIIGRRGSGKTSFLIGSALAEGSLTVRIQSRDIYGEIDRTIKEYKNEISELDVDNTCYIWEVLLTHAALLVLARANFKSTETSEIWSYVSTYGAPNLLKTDDYISLVAHEIRSCILDKDALGSFRKKCHNIVRQNLEFGTAELAMASLVEENEISISVVIDNLEDLGRKIHSFVDTVSGLFRFAARTKDFDDRIVTPYSSQFCLPFEVMPAIYSVVANAEKDLRGHMTIEWGARELIELAATRFCYYIKSNNLEDLLVGRVRASFERFTESEKESDAVEVLRGVLPNEVITKFGTSEDPIAYVLRHTQLLPRQIITIFNSIFECWSSRTAGRITPNEIIEGVEKSEAALASTVIAAYELEYLSMNDALDTLNNKLPLLFELKFLRKYYNENSTSTSGIEFDDFLSGMIAIGVLGRRIPSRSKRYTVAEFAYIFGDSMPGISDDEVVCIHPMFMKRLHDAQSIASIARENPRPVYPRGSGLDEDYRVHL